MTILDHDSFGGLSPDGKRRIDLEAFGMRFPDYLAVTYDFFGGQAGSGIPDGLIGGDLLRHFALWIDYRGARGGLFASGALPAPAASQTGTPTRLGFELAGGGAYYVPGNCGMGPFCGTITTPATRVLLRAKLEAQAAPIWVMLDTGASATVMTEDFWATLGDPARPRLDGVTVIAAEGPVTAALSRVARLELLPAADSYDGAAGAATTDVPVLVLPLDTLFQSISDETGEDVEMLIGGAWLRAFEVGLDYPARDLVLAPYTSLDHVPADEYVGPGFTLGRDGSGVWRVGDVYPGTDAAAEGLESGEIVDELGGMAIGGLPRASVEALLDGYALGQDIPVGVMREGQPVTLGVAVEDLLPRYPGASP